NRQIQFEKLCDLVGRPELKTDPRFAERESRKVHRMELKAELEVALRARNAAEWAELLCAHGVPAGEVLTVPQALAQPQIAHRDFLKTFDNVLGVNRPIRVSRAGCRLASGDPGPARPPPTL